MRDVRPTFLNHRRRLNVLSGWRGCKIAAAGPRRIVCSVSAPSLQEWYRSQTENGRTHLDQSLALLRKALSIQDAHGSPIVAAHISYAIDLLEGHGSDEVVKLRESPLSH